LKSASRDNDPVPKGWSLADHANEIGLCASCPKLCRHVCPVAEAEQRETVTPWALMTTAFLQLHDSGATLEGGEAWPYHCTDCGACRQACKFSNDVPGTLHALRADVLARGQAPERVQTALARYRRNRGNLYQPDVASRLHQLLPARRLRPDAPVRVLVDPTTLVRYPDMVRAADTLLTLLDFEEVAFVAQPSIGGVGHLFYHLGDLEGFAEHAHRLHQTLDGCKRLYTLRPGDAFLLRDIYPRFGIRWHTEIGAFLELIASRQAGLRPIESPPVVLHEACHLGRALDRADLAVTLVKAATGRRPRVPFRSGAESTCCGGGGGLPVVLPEVAHRVARICAQRLSPREDEVLVTTCSTCRRQLEAVVKSPVRDILSLLAGHL